MSEFLQFSRIAYGALAAFVGYKAFGISILVAEENKKEAAERKRLEKTQKDCLDTLRYNDRRVNSCRPQIAVDAATIPLVVERLTIDERLDRMQKKYPILTADLLKVRISDSYSLEGPRGVYEKFIEYEPSTEFRVRVLREVEKFEKAEGLFEFRLVHDLSKVPKDLTSVPDW